MVTVLKQNSKQIGAILIALILLSPIVVCAQIGTEEEDFFKSVRDSVVLWNAKIDSLSAELTTARESKSADTVVKKTQIRDAVNTCFQIPQGYIQANPASMFCLRALNMLGEGDIGSPVSLADLTKLFNSLSDQVKISERGKLYSGQLASWGWMQKLEKVAKESPDFKSISKTYARLELEHGVNKTTIISNFKPVTIPLTESELYTKVKSSTLVVNMALEREQNGKKVVGSNPATAYVIDPSGICVTNYHVVKEYAGNGPYLSLSVMTASGKTYSVVSVLAASEANDLAIIKINLGEDKLPSLTLGSNVAVGADIYIVSHPMLINRQYKMVFFDFYAASSGKVLANEKYVHLGKQVPVMNISAPFGQGSSGGPIVDKYGNVVGTVSRLMGEHKIGIPVSEVKKLIEFKK